MYKYDTDIIKKNIETFMRDKGISQKMLSDNTGIAQPRVSKCLKISEKDQFTFEQIVNIANVLEVSIDDIIGKADKVNKYSMYSFFENAAISNPSMADFAALFFNIYQELSIKIEFDDEEKDFPHVVFYNSGIEEFLYMFHKVSMASHNSGMGDKLLRIWVNDYIRENQNYDIENMPYKFVETTMSLTDTYRNRENKRVRNYELIRPSTREKLDLPKAHIANNPDYRFEMNYGTVHKGSKIVELIDPDGGKRTIEMEECCNMDGYDEG